MSSPRAALLIVACASCTRTTELRPAGTPAGGSAGAPFSGEYLHPKAPADIRESFAGPTATTAAAKPRLVYPLDGALLARNWGGMSVQWAAGDGNHLFRVAVVGQQGRATLYAADDVCPGARCTLPVPDVLWLSIASANPDARVEVVVDATPARGGPVATSDAVALVFSPEELHGDLLYWSAGTSGIVRVASGDTGRRALIDPSTPPVPAGPRVCVGCHSVSDDGCLIGLSYEGDHQYVLGVAEAKGATRAIDSLSVGDDVSFTAVSHAGKRMMTVRAGKLTLRDRAGRKILDVPRDLIGPAGNDFATHPEWTPDGRHLVLTRAAVDQPESTSDWTETGDIVVMPMDGDQPGAARVLVARTALESHFYPHVSSDGRWVVFNTGRSPGQATRPAPTGRVSAYAQTTARLRLVAFDGAAPIELSRATHGSGVMASRPSFARFVQRGGTLFFITFSSKLDYGWIIDQATVPATTLSAPGRAQIWMAAIDLGRGGDPSFSPFWLPTQDVTDVNYGATWIPEGSSCPN